MKEIIYTVNNESGSIFWAASENFKELEGISFNLQAMEAVRIEKLDNISTTAKILLSAVAGAIIQHLIDKGMDAKEIFSSGSFTVKK